MKKHTRRTFIKHTGGAMLMSPLIASASLSEFQDKPLNAIDGESKNQTLRKASGNLKFNILEFGAKGDGVTKNTKVIQQAIDRCWVLGGGEVLVPAGEYLTGAIALRSNVTLRLETDAMIKGSNDLNDYPVMQVRWEGKWIQGHIGLIYATDEENIAIVGKGKIAGSYQVGGRPDKKNPLRHPALIEPIGCSNVRFEDFSTDYHHMWCIHPVYSENIFIRNLIIRSTGGNGDGIDIDSCKHVKIDGCDIFTGDDCIAIKSGRGMEAWEIGWTTEDVHITNCTFADSIFACIGIGSEGSAGIRNVKIEHCKFTHAKTFAIYIKSRPGRGAFYEDIYVDDIEVSGMKGGFLRFNMLKSGIQDAHPIPGYDGIPTARNFHFSNIRVKDVPILVDGTSVHPDKPLEGFVLENISGTCRKGIQLANIKNAKIKNIYVSGYEGSLLGTYNVSGEGINEAVDINAPEVEPPIPENEPPYILH